MGELTLAQYKSRVKLACGNVPDAHPVIAAGIHTTAINNAPNQLIRENADLFPEHQGNTWTIGPTVTTVGDNNLVALPENLLVLGRVTHSRDAVPASGGDWTLIQEYPVALIDMPVVGMIAKPTTVTGYPSMCSRKGNSLLYNPSTQTGYTTYFRIYGLAGELPLTASGETFRMHRDFDSIIVLYAAAETLTMMGQHDDAATVLATAERSLSKMRSVVAKERAARPMSVTIAGMPR